MIIDELYDIKSPYNTWAFTFGNTNEHRKHNFKIIILLIVFCAFPLIICMQSIRLLAGPLFANTLGESMMIKVRVMVKVS